VQANAHRFGQGFQGSLSEHGTILSGLVHAR
jgi:hypothetical protein